MRIIEVAPRDGLQNEKTPIATDAKQSFIRALLAAGLNEIELTSFVSPKWVPQLADAMEVLADLPNGGIYSALVPNDRGLDRAIESGIGRIAVFTAASDAFTQANVNMTVAQTLDNFRPMIERFRESRPNGFVRGYVSTIIECPYAGMIDPCQVGTVVDALFEMGVDEVSLGETIGVAVPSEVRGLFPILADYDKAKIVWHFHDTRGTAIANVAAAMDAGYKNFDSAAAGLGGCPYAKGAGGNLATEDLVYFLERNGIDTGVDITALAQASLPILAALGKPVTSRAQLAALASPC